MKPSQFQPTFGSIDILADEQDRKQQKERQKIKPQAHPLQLLIISQQAAEHEREADTEPHQLLDEKVMSGMCLNLIVESAVDAQQTNADDADQHPDD